MGGTRTTAVALWIAGAIAMSTPVEALAKVAIAVDLSTQTMHVVADDGTTYDWPVSSGREGLETSTGLFAVQWMDKDHRSKEFHDSPMPNAIFFKGGEAIHGTYESIDGYADSHGCVRLSVPHSATLFRMVKAEGASIEITGTAPRRAETAHRRRSRPDPAEEFDASSAPTFADQETAPRASRRRGYGDVQFGPVDDPVPRRRGVDPDAQRAYDFGDGD